METVILVAYLLIVVAMIGVILVQRSEGGALGIGGGSGGFMSARGSANLLTRTTAVLATLFFALAIAQTVMSELNRTGSSILERANQTEGGAAAPTSVLDSLNQMQGTDTAPAAPASSTPAVDPGLAVPSSAGAGTPGVVETTPSSGGATDGANTTPIENSNSMMSTPVQPAATQPATTTTETPAATPSADPGLAVPTTGADAGQPAQPATN